jgi:hypothetical protein
MLVVDGLAPILAVSKTIQHTYDFQIQSGITI